jgi:Baseplate J-like protein
MAEINTEAIGLYLPALDPRNEEMLARQAQTVVFNRSQGQLNDFSDHSPTAALIQGQAFAAAELLYYANKLPLALVLQLLELTGVQRNLGARSQVALTFTLTAPRSSTYTVPVGFEVRSRTGLAFQTDAELVIPPGVISGVVNATAVALGTAYNLPAFTITQLIQPLTFLAGVVNREPSQGGAPAEAVETAIARGLAQLRRRNLVSAPDFEEAAEEILGQKSTAKAIGLLNADKISYEPGVVHVFCLDNSGNPATAAQLSSVRQVLARRLMLGTRLYVSPMELVPIQVRLIGRLGSESADAVADRLWAALQTYLSPQRWKTGGSLLLKEVEYELRLAGGLKYVEELLLNDDAVNVPMPNEYSVPSAYSMTALLTNDSGQLFNLLRGAGEPPDFDPQI